MDPDSYSEGDCFDISGPAHLMSKADDGSSLIIPIDWGNKEHCRCVVACLVKATYIIEKERTRQCRALQLAPTWWERFHFSLRGELKDKRDDTFGAIFEHALPGSCHKSTSAAPQYVITFRGTMLTKRRDLYHDWKIVANSLRDTERFQRGHQAVAELLAGAASPVVWLTGHSLGASLALELGRAMMSEQGLNLPTILFNPPQVSLEQAIDMSPFQEETKKKLHAGGGMVKAVAASLLRTNHPKQHTMEEQFQRLSSWVPELYVHEGDPICQGFISYFEQQQQVEGRQRLPGVAAQSSSFRGMFSSAVRGKEKEQPHLLPSATLWRTKSEPSDLLRAHGIKQWGKQDDELKLITRRYSIIP